MLIICVNRSWNVAWSVGISSELISSHSLSEVSWSLGKQQDSEKDVAGKEGTVSVSGLKLRGMRELCAQKGSV